MTASSAETRPVADWMRVLEQMEETLGRQLAQVAEPAAPPAGAAPPAKTPLQVLDGRLAEMQARLAQPERDAAEVDAVLRTEAEALQRWTEGMTAVRRRLGDWAARGK